MRRKIVIAVALLTVVGALVLAWPDDDGPPGEWIEKYGDPPFCKPTGNTMTIEGVEFVEISPGCFRIGSEFLAEGGDFLGRWCARLGLPWGDQPKASDEMPVHWVEFPRGFWIARTEITNERYERFQADHEPSDFSPGDRHPVVQVSWEDANAYCEWLSGKSGLDIRLPSEAMWEAACRGGSEREFCFGDDEDRLGDFAWYDENSKGEAHEVGTRRANGWGLFDFHGNAWEWCEDAYHGSYEDGPSDGSAWTGGGVEWDVGSPYRVCRGGSWSLPAVSCRSASRSWFLPSNRHFNLGFRPCIWPSED